MTLQEFVQIILDFLIKLMELLNSEIKDVITHFSCTGHSFLFN